MAGGCLSSLFKYISVLLVGVGLYDVEASRCQRVIHKTVGDTVEFSSCLTTEGVTAAQWKYGGLLIADKEGAVGKHQFTGRLDINTTNFSLTVRRLTLQDSGDFSFLSEAYDKQRKTVTITLLVHESITKEPIIISNSTWHTLNESCTVLLDCSTTTTDSNVSYNWSVRNQTISGSRLQYIIERQDEDTKFTCTVSNFVSEMSTVKTVMCNNITSDAPEMVSATNLIVYLSAAGGGLFLIIVVIVGVVVVCRHKQSQEGSDSNDLTVYADITDVAIEDRTSSTMKNCTLYETIDKRTEAVTPGPQTVYDEIQLSRMRKTSVSPYQDVS